MMNGLVGILTGFGGSLINRGFDFFERKQNHEFELQKFNQEAELYKLQSEYQQQQTLLENEHDEVVQEFDLDRTQLETSHEAMKASYAHDTETGKGSQWVTNTLRLVRPIITVGLVILVATLAFTVGDAIQEKLVYASIELCGTAVGWWFGDRSFKRTNKNQEGV